MDRSPNDQEENRYKLKNLNFIALRQILLGTV